MDHTQLIGTSIIRHSSDRCSPRSIRFGVRARIDLVYRDDANRRAIDVRDPWALCLSKICTSTTAAHSGGSYGGDRFRDS